MLYLEAVLYTRAPLRPRLVGFSFPTLPNILGNNFAVGTSTPGKLISESKILIILPL